MNALWTRLLYLPKYVKWPCQFVNNTLTYYILSNFLLVTYHAIKFDNRVLWTTRSDIKMNIDFETMAVLEEESQNVSSHISLFCRFYSWNRICLRLFIARLLMTDYFLPPCEVMRRYYYQLSIAKSIL